MRLALCLFTLFLSLSLLFATSFSVALAQESDPPTPTLGPFSFSTPTPVSITPGLHPCPEGLPSGFGSITPSRRWLYECSHCLLSLYPTSTPLSLTPRFLLTPIPTLDIFSTPTPYGFVATATPTPAPTPTATSTPPPPPSLSLAGFYKYSAADEEVYVSSGYWVDSYYLKVQRASSYNPQNYSYFVQTYKSGIVACDSNGNLKVSSASFNIDWNRIFSYDYEVSFCSSGRDGLGCGSVSAYGLKADSDIVFCSNSSSSKCLECNLDSLEAKITIHSTTLDDMNHGLIFTTRGLMAYSQKVIFNSHKRYLSSLPVPATPTPFPTATPDTYCFAVVEDSEPDISLPVFQIGNSFCYGLNAFNTTIPIFGEFSFPGIHVCFDEITFGSINIFGLQISIDLLSSVIAAVVTLRILLRS